MVIEVISLCECGCGLPAPIAKRTRFDRGQVKGLPLRFINGHNSRLIPSEEQKRRSLLKDPDKLRYTGKRSNYVKLNQRHMHRVVVERHIGRKLESFEIVHHRDEDKWNNDITNLEIMTQAEHAALHSRQRRQGQ